MRNFYLYETALKADSIPELELGINNLNSILVNRDYVRDYFLCNPTIWECDTTQGRIYEMFGGIINSELQRLIPKIFESFVSQAEIYDSHIQFDLNYPNDCNAFVGFEFKHTQVLNDRQISALSQYRAFILKCLKYGSIADVIEMRENLLILFPTFTFEDRAVEECLMWKNDNIGLYERLFDLLNDIQANPFMGGLGETEVLKHINANSKRINQANRVTYRFGANNTTILACSGHYN